MWFKHLHQIYLDDEQHIINVILSGYVTLDDRINLVHALCTDYTQHLKRFHILIDGSQIDNTLSEHEQELLGKFIGSKEEFKYCKTAVVLNVEKRNKDIIKFAVSKGLKIAYFQDKTSAINWILDSPT